MTLDRILKSRRALTLTELLVVLAIISLLATLAVPVYVQKTEQARRAVARSEVRTIAEAEEAVAITHGFYVPMHILDNLPNPAPGASTTSITRDDFESDGALSQKYAIDPFTSLEAQAGGTAAMSLDPNSTSIDARVRRMVEGWGGPFLNPVRVATDPNDPDQNPSFQSQEFVSHDIILDPWGRPYRFYTPIGVTGDNTSVPDSPTDVANVIDRLDSAAELRSFDDGRINNSDPLFDRYAIVSFGANGYADENGNAGNEIDDDIFYTFGVVTNESAFNSF